MRQFLVENLDYIFFVYGFAFILMAGSCFPLLNKKDETFPWLWIGLFGLLHGINEWLDMIVVSWGDTSSFGIVRVVFLLASFVCLFEFGRQGMNVTGKRNIGIWIYVPLLLLTFFGFFFGAKGVNTAARYALGFPAATLSAFSLIRFAENQGSVRRRYLTIAALGLALYGIVTGLVGPNAGFFPSTVINHESWLATFQFPVQLLRAALACLISFAFFESYKAVERHAKFGMSLLPSVRGLRYFVFNLFTSLVVGWGGVHFVGNYAERTEGEVEFFEFSKSVENQLVSSLFLSEKVLESMCKSPIFVSPDLSSLNKSDGLNSVLDRYSELVPGGVAYVINEKGIVIASSNRNSFDSFVGKNYGIRPYFVSGIRGDRGYYFAMGLTSNVPGYYVSAPIWDRAGDVRAVAVVKTAIPSEVFRRYAGQQSFLLSPDGAVLMASTPAWALKALWPMSKKDIEKILASKQIPSLNTEPLVQKEIQNDENVYIGGKKYHAFRKTLPYSNWIMVTAFAYKGGAIFRFLFIIVTLILALFILTFFLVREHDAEQKAYISMSEKLHRSMFEKNQAVMLVIDPGAAKILDANAAAIEFYGYTREKLVDMKISEINLLPEGEVLDSVSSVVQKGCSHFVFRHKLSNSEVRDVEVYATPLDFGDKRVVLSIIHDVSDRMRAEKQREVAQTQLLHSSRLASIGTLASGVAHEINNPLNIVLAYLAELEENRLLISDPRSKTLLHKIHQTIERIGVIVKGLRTYARPVSEVIEDVDMHVLINETIEMVKGMYSKKQIVLETNFECDKPMFQGSSGKMQQVLLNLISNARDAVESKPENERRITLCTRHVDKAIIVEVRDTGTGIPPEVFGSIFDPFFTTKGPGKGTGLGLPISQSLLNAMGGELLVRTQVGKGTTFIIRVPQVS